jgi:hypothetical protein
MTQETDDPDRAADRLEAALERIARRTVLAGPPSGSPAVPAAATADRDAALAAGLDTLIERLRAALADRPD